MSFSLTRKKLEHTLRAIGSGDIHIDGRTHGIRQRMKEGLDCHILDRRVE